jgi:hypothetical protein
MDQASSVPTANDCLAPCAYSKCRASLQAHGPPVHLLAQRFLSSWTVSRFPLYCLTLQAPVAKPRVNLSACGSLPLFTRRGDNNASAGTVVHSLFLTIHVIPLSLLPTSLALFVLDTPLCRCGRSALLCLAITLEPASSIQSFHHKASLRLPSILLTPSTRSRTLRCPDQHATTHQSLASRDPHYQLGKPRKPPTCSSNRRPAAPFWDCSHWYPPPLHIHGSSK